MTAPARITHGLPFADYLALPGRNFTSLKHAARSLRHYQHALTNARPDTRALTVGRATHCAILTPAEQMPPGPEWAVYSGKVRRGKEWEAFKAENLARGLVPTIQSEVDEAEERDRAVNAMRAAVFANEHARALLADGAGEVTVEWSHAATGLPLRGRLDWRGRAGIVDLKTTRAIDRAAFTRECAVRAYHAQAGLYANAIESVDGTVEPYHIIAVENVPPWDVAVYRVPDEVIAEGWRVAQTWIYAVAGAERTGAWPGVGGNGVLELELPPWAMVGPAVTMGGVSLDEAFGDLEEVA